jgi:elongation factor Ts
MSSTTCASPRRRTSRSARSRGRGCRGQRARRLPAQRGRARLNGVIIERRGGCRDPARDRPAHRLREADGLTRDEVDPAAIEAERESALGVTKAEGKPEAAWEKIVEGRVNKWLADRVLIEQGVFGEKQTVAERIGSGTIVRFVQAYIGD